MPERQEARMKPASEAPYLSQAGGRGDCIFCSIVSGRAPSKIVYQDEGYIAFLDAFPVSRGHTLVCPKKHGATIWDMGEEEIAGLFRVASRVSRAVVKAVGAEGFRFVQNNGEAADQVVAHVHVHVIPVRMQDRGRFAGRRQLGSDEMESTARGIRDEMRSAGAD
jgi:histidine triad (HIT) family protein